MIEEYAALREKADTSPRGMLALIKAADLHYQFETLPEDLWAALLLHGLIGLDQRTAGELLGVSAMTISRRYAAALDEITYYINHRGGPPPGRED